MLYRLYRLYVRLCILKWDENFWAWIGGKFDSSKHNSYKTTLKYSTKRTWKYLTNTTAKADYYLSWPRFNPTASNIHVNYIRTFNYLFVKVQVLFSQACYFRFLMKLKCSWLMKSVVWYDTPGIKTQCLIRLINKTTNVMQLGVIVFIILLR